MACTLLLLMLLLLMMMTTMTTVMTNDVTMYGQVDFHLSPTLHHALPADPWGKNPFGYPVDGCDSVGPTFRCNNVVKFLHSEDFSV
jgi:hypothetical protein